MQNIISVKGLTKQFHNLTAVNQLSFTVNNGDVYGFLGQNGAGKSTTLRMLLTLIEPTEGSIEVAGMDLLKHHKEVLRNIGAVIEKPDVYKYLSAYENVQLFAKLSGVRLSKEQIMQQLAMVGLQDRANDKVKTFSQGMKQRVGIAIALVHNPQIVILDEPTNGLDPQGIADIRNMILHLSRDLKKTVVVSSHLLSEIEQVATRVLIIDKGKKLVEGNADELFDPSETIVELETANNHFAFNQLEQSNWNNYLLRERKGNPVLKLNKKDIPQLHKDLVALNIELIAMQPKHSLEDYFLRITSANYS
ncbi:MAG: bacitracin ABC transporter ATP-binding protein [Chitinophaga sp.]|jgi:ABC-type multidrug transport system ATPase subunit|nr:bacitracin ABC transporter ATP-binding protein [Chitinophaga sp.]